MGRQTTKTIVAMNKTMRFNNLLKPHIPSFRFSKLYKRRNVRLEKFVKTHRFDNLLKPHIPSFRFSKLYKRFHNKHYVLFDSHSSCNKGKRFGDVLKKSKRSDRK